jgi:hypothetical protein
LHISSFVGLIAPSSFRAAWMLVIALDEFFDSGVVVLVQQTICACSHDYARQFANLGENHHRLRLGAVVARRKIPAWLAAVSPLIFSYV